MSHTFLTKAQFVKAMLIAEKHGHAWACEERVRELFANDDLMPSVELITAIMAARCQAINSQGLRQVMEMGIWHPTVDDGVVVHATGTGRLEWRVYRDGTVDLKVNRPFTCVICLSVRDAAVSITYQTAPALIFVRHVKAAEMVLEAILDRDKVAAALAGLFAVAQPDPEPKASVDEVVPEASVPASE